MHRWLVLVLAALVGCLVLPATASATTVASYDSDGLVLVGDGSAQFLEVTLVELENGGAGPNFVMEVRDSNSGGFTHPGSCSVTGNVLHCDGVPGNTIDANLGDGNDDFVVATTQMVHLDVVGGEGVDNLAGGAGTDTLNSGNSLPSTSPETLNGGGGPDLLLGGEGPDIYRGGPDADTFQDDGTQGEDKVVYGGEGRTEPVTVTMDDGAANDGHPNYDGQSPVNPLLGGDFVGPGIVRVDGTEHNDSLTGRANHADTLFGSNGNDTLNGLGGADTFFGGAGDDTLNANDGVADARIDCDVNDVAPEGTADVANVDAADPAPIDCETVKRPGGGGGGGGGGGATPTTPGTQTPAPTVGDLTPKEPVEVYPQQTFKMVSFLRGARTCGAKRFCRALEVKRYLDKKKLHFRLDIRDATDKALAAAEGRRVVPGEVILQDPKQDEEVASGAKQAFRMKIHTFDPEDIANCNLRRPFVRIGQVLYRLTDLLKDVSLRRAEEILRDANCKRDQYELLTKVVRGASDTVVKRATILKKKRIRLTVHHGSPEIQFAYTKPRLVSGYLPPLWGDNNEVVLPRDESFTLFVHPTKNGVGIGNLYVQLRDEKGNLEELGRTNANGIADISGGIDKSGRYELFASLCDKEQDCVVGWKRIDVAKLDKRRTYLGLDGLTYGNSDGRWKPVAAAASTRARAAQAPDKASLGTLAAEIVTRVALSPLFYQASIRDPTGPLYAAVLKLNAAAGAAIGKGMAGYYDALVARGIEFTILAGGGNTPTTISRVDFVRRNAIYSDGTRTVSVPITAIDTNNGAVALKVDNFMFLPGGLFYLVTGGGTTAGPVQRIQPVSATTPGLDLVRMSGATAIGIDDAGASPLIGADGGTLVGTDAGSLIGMDGGSLIGMDGASLIGMDGASLIGADGASLIGADGGSLIGADGASIISRDGAGLFPPR